MDKECIETEVLNNVFIVKFISNVLSAKAFSELDDILTTLESDCKYDGVVFTSDKPKIFLAGADLFHLNDLIKAQDIRGLRQVIQTGQATFNRIANLPFTTVAAIHGACVGGGFELGLACDYRICSNDKSTKIGLPEVTLGILPAWGGTTRLTRLTSLPNALKVMLTGAQFAAKPALKLGLVDKVVHYENLIHESIAQLKKPVKRSQPLVHRLLPNTLVLNRARKTALSKTKGNYPAPLKILDVVSKGLSVKPRECMQLEEDAFIELSRTDVMHNLLRIFFLQEKSKKLLVDDRKYARVSDTVVVGAGTMGAGIAQWVSSRGVNVLLKDVTDELVAKGLKSIGDLYVQGVLGYKMDRPTAKSGLARVTTATTDVPLHNKDILIEVIVEDLSVKRKVLAQLEGELPDDAVIATNTSALSIDQMANCLRQPERFVGIHFFNPVHKMKLVEVVRGSKTDDITVKRAVEFVQQIGKLPVVVKDSPGFVVNRILVPYLMKATELLSEGGQIEAIDSAMIKFGMPMGPFRLMDEIGLDVCYHVMADISNRLNIDCSCEAGLEVADRIGQNHLGKKTGEGFYTYRKGKAVRRKAAKLKIDISPLIDCMTDEAQKVLDEGVAESADDIDFAMIMGTGWAPFRGGPLAHNNSILTC